MKTRKLRLTSEFERGVPEAEEFAIDDEGRDWPYFVPDRSDVREEADQLLPEWPPCVTCGVGVDAAYEPHWWHGRDPADDLFVHPQCVELTHPKAETER